MGLVAPAILPARLVLQESIKQVSGWDDMIPDGLVKRWNQWWSNLLLIERLKIPRWLGIGCDDRCQLHIFADASEIGYGVVAYVRTGVDDVRCNILYSRSRVTPLKKQTVPRLELTAATLAVKSIDLVTRETEAKFASVHYWTDSVLVLNYINNTKTRFSTFVANRINVIHSGSSPKQWRHVEGKLNPADMASRGLNLKDSDQVARWLGGPEFLREDMKQWAKPFRSSRLDENNPEVREVTCVTIQPMDSIELIMQHYSSYYRLKRAIAWLLRLRNALRRQEIVKTALTPDELRNAEVEIVKHVQGRSFADEIVAIESNKRIKKSSNIGKLNPFLDNGVLATHLGTGKYPMIIPRKHRIANLIMRETHQIAGHCGRNNLVSMVRKTYWIPQLPSAARGLVSKCVLCRKYNRSQENQKMADLPVERIAVGERPFCCTGMDYFGPFEVKRGRSTQKRYGVLFTCLKTRAVHLEVSSSLTTDWCVHAIRRFISRRGPVETMWSDNGTNLVGAKRELQESTVWCYERAADKDR